MPQVPYSLEGAKELQPGGFGGMNVETPHPQMTDEGVKSLEQSAYLRGEAGRTAERQLEKAGSAIFSAGMKQFELANDAEAKDLYIRGTAQTAAMTQQFFALTGKNATEGLKGASDNLMALRQQLLAKASNPFVRQNLDDYFTRRAGLELLEMSRHAATEGKRYISETNQGMIDAANYDVGMGVPWPNFQLSLKNVTEAVRKTGENEGWPEEKIKSEIQMKTTGLYNTRWNEMMLRRPEEALREFKEHRGELEPKQASVIERRLLLGMNDISAKQVADEISENTIGPIAGGASYSYLGGVQKTEGERLELPRIPTTTGGHTAAERHNNPGNVSLPIAGYHGPGEVAGISGQPGHGSFPTIQDGINALDARLASRISQGYDTIRKLGMSGIYENPPTMAWVNHVSAMSGIGPDEQLTPGRMQALRYGIVQQETGGIAAKFGISRAGVSWIGMHEQDTISKEFGANKKILEKEGISITDKNMYMARLLGADNAVKFLHGLEYDPTSKADVPADFFKRHPEFEGKTAQEVYDKATANFSDARPGGPERSIEDRVQAGLAKAARMMPKEEWGAQADVYADNVRRHIESRYREESLAEREKINNAKMSVYDRLFLQGDMKEDFNTRVKNDPAIMQGLSIMQPPDQVTVRNKYEAMRKREANDDPDGSRAQRAAELGVLAGTNPAKFIDTDLMKENLTKRGLDKLVKMQKDLDAGRYEPPKYLTAMRALSSEGFFQQYGMYPDAKSTQWQHFLAAMSLWSEAYKETYAKDPMPQEYREASRNLLANSEEYAGAWKHWPSTELKEFEVKPTAQDRQAIIDRYTSAPWNTKHVTPNEREIQGLWELQQASKVPQE
jgi:hypothetical protein